jgi:hypothetical protein
VTYTVQSGDTLFSIARRYNVEMETIQRANCMQGHAVKAEDTIFVPARASVPPPKRYPVPVLLSPEDGANFPAGAQVTVSWQWDGELGEDEHFDVRLWKEGAPHYGIGWSKEGRYAVKGEPGVAYYWSVAVIHGKDGTMERELSPESPPRKISWGDVE